MPPNRRAAPESDSEADDSQPETAEAAVSSFVTVTVTVSDDLAAGCSAVGPALQEHHDHTGNSLSRCTVPVTTREIPSPTADSEPESLCTLTTVTGRGDSAG